MKKIEDFSNYSVTEDGKIWSASRKRFLVGGVDEDGYRQHILCDKGRRKCCKVHRLVALYYIPNPENHPVINHLNGVKTDNRVENLEWCTVSHNTKHAYKLGALDQRGEKNNLAKFTDEEVKSIIDGYPGGSIASYAREIGKPYGSIYAFIKQLRRLG